MSAGTGTTLTVYGATGYTGRLCAVEAARCGLPLRIAGRRREALEALAAELGTSVRVVVADADDADALAALAVTSDVLLSTVGPYVRRGQQVLDAAIHGGAGYVDVSGEVAFLEQVHRQTGRVQAADLTACPGFGFDGAPGDLLAGIAAAALPVPVRSVRVGYAVRNGAASAGTVRSGLGVALGGGAAWRDGALVEEPLGASRWEAPFPDRPRTTLSAPLPEVVTTGRSTGAATVRAYAAVPAAELLAAVAGPGTSLLRLLSRTPAWGLLQRGVDALPSGPSPQRRARTQALVVAEVRGASEGGGPPVAAAWARIDDVYGTTARLAVAVCARLLDGRLSRRGVLTPGQAFDARQAGALLTEVGAQWGRLEREEGAPRRGAGAFPSRG